MTYPVEKLTERALRDAGFAPAAGDVLVVGEMQGELVARRILNGDVWPGMSHLNVVVDPDIEGWEIRRGDA